VAEPALKQRAGANLPELTVSELAGAIKSTLEQSFGYVRLRGEISGYRGPHSSGHCYFALKDERAKIEAVVWRGTLGRLKVRPEEGMEVVAHGRITTYPGSSKYQIVIEAMEPAGIGALMALLEERKRKLAAEGLFEAERKRKLPFLPAVVGIITSPTGAVIRDMLAGFAERFPTRVIVWPVRVQGETSAGEVAAAINGFNALTPGGRIPRPDVLIVARGGGSLEDLWSFNEEAVVRAAAASTIPIVSAVGHETDWTLIDLAADARAPTPTKAAEWVVPKHADLIEEIGKLGLRLAVAARRLNEARRTELKAAARGLPRPDDLVAMPRQRLDGLTPRLAQGFRALMQARRTALARSGGRLPRPRTLVQLPRQRLDATGRRLGGALVASTGALKVRLARVAARVTPRLVAGGLDRARHRLERIGGQGAAALERLTAARRTRLERTTARLQPAALAARITRGRERLDERSRRLRQAIGQRLAGERQRLGARDQLLASLSYQSILKRGYALVRDGDGRAVRSAAIVKPGDRLDIELADGRVGASAGEVRLVAGSGEEGAREAAPRPAPGPAAARPARSGGGRDGGGQGSLF
jgi:exodeoxyribonuclease VII large subunit